MHLLTAAEKAEAHGVSWSTPIVLTLGRLREEEPEFQASLSHSKFQPRLGILERGPVF